MLPADILKCILLYANIQLIVSIISTSKFNLCLCDKYCSHETTNLIKYYTIDLNDTQFKLILTKMIYHKKDSAIYDFDEIPLF